METFESTFAPLQLEEYNKKIFPTCPICLEELNFIDPGPDKRATSTQCGHIFCKIPNVSSLLLDFSSKHAELRTCFGALGFLIPLARAATSPVLLHNGLPRRKLQAELRIKIGNQSNSVHRHKLLKSIEPLVSKSMVGSLRHQLVVGRHRSRTCLSRVRSASFLLLICRRGLVLSIFLLLVILESEKFHEMAAATESPPKGGFRFDDDAEFPPVTQKTELAGRGLMLVFKPDVSALTAENIFS
ncbi:hypothetical protein C0J52_27475 [Blattella germanica]|nr:hypothetical protein C0J52_27475 [Blattella germanica]